MNRKQLAILIVVVLVLGGASVALRQNQKASWKSGDAQAGKKLLGDLSVNDVARLAIRQGTNEVHLVKKENLWRVQERRDYPADYQAISAFLLKAKDLKVVQTERVGPSQLPRLDLAPGQGSNSPVVVEFQDNSGKTLHTLLLGKKHFKKSPDPSARGDDAWPDGRYVQTMSDAGTVALISDPLENMEPRPEQWLNHDFVRVEKVRTLAVSFENAPTNSWKAARESETADWKLVDAAVNDALETDEVSSAAGMFNGLRFTDVIPGDALSGADPKPALVSVETFDDFVYTFRVGAETNEARLVTVKVAGRLPAERSAGKDEKPEEKAKLDQEFKERKQKLEEKLRLEQDFANWTFRVASWSIQPVLKARSELMKKPSPPPSEAGNAGGPFPTGP